MPPDWFVEPLMALAVSVVKNTGLRSPSMRLVVDAELGLRLGIAPGETMAIHTVAGYVNVESKSPNPGRMSIRAQ
jgi:hypothetical protein